MGKRSPFLDCKLWVWHMCMSAEDQTAALRFNDDTFHLTQTFAHVCLHNPIYGHKGTHVAIVDVVDVDLCR